MPNNAKRKGWEALALAIAGGATQRDAAAVAGINEVTACRRMKEPAFRALVTELRQRLISEAVGRLATNMAQSADTLRQLQADDVKSSTRLGAARATLELGCKMHESTELEARLAALERAAKGRGACPPDKPPGPTEDGATPTEDDGLPTESNGNVD